MNKLISANYFFGNYLFGRIHLLVTPQTGAWFMEKIVQSYTKEAVVNYPPFYLKHFKFLKTNVFFSLRKVFLYIIEKLLQMKSDFSSVVSNWSSCWFEKPFKHLITPTISTIVLLIYVTVPEQFKHFVWKEWNFSLFDLLINAKNKILYIVSLWHILKIA